MDQDADPEEKARRAEFDKHYAKFYELIGHCVTRYQTIEDYLESVFAAALASDENRAKAMFAVARGLEAKLNIITAALVSREDDLANYWPDLLTRVAKAANARNEIAHASPLLRGGGARLIMDREKMEVVSIERIDKDRMELRKRTKTGEKVWTLDQMLEEVRRNEKLFSNLIGFTKLLQGEKPPARQLDGLKT